MVHQELSVVPGLSVAENVHLGAQPVQRLRACRLAGDAPREPPSISANLGIDVDPRSLMGGLPLGLQQLVEVARVLFSGARIIILDEPTSALGATRGGAAVQPAAPVARGGPKHRFHLAFSR